MTTQPETQPLVAIETDQGQKAEARTAGVAFHTADHGEANCSRYGVAYCERSGTAKAGAAGVAYVRNGGFAETGDGGVSVCKGSYSKASCESWGVAFARSESRETLGRVKGGNASVLVLTWVDDDAPPKTQVRSIQVGSTDSHGTKICPGKWYSLDTQDSTRWIDVTDTPDP